MGDWELGIGPNPQSPIPNPQSPIPKKFFCNYLMKFFRLIKNKKKFKKYNILMIKIKLNVI